MVKKFVRKREYRLLLSKKKINGETLYWSVNVFLKENDKKNKLLVFKDYSDTDWYVVDENMVVGYMGTHDDGKYKCEDIVEGWQW